MPADHLTRPSLPSQPAIITAVQEILAGTPTEMAAANTGVNAADLAEAVQTYHAAGIAALQAQAATDWCHIRLEFPDWQAAEHCAAVALAPQLRRLQADGYVTNWWFIRKYPHWRLRLSRPDHGPGNTSYIGAVLDELVAARAIRRWDLGIYEPEIAAFGGPAGIDIAHRLFCADSDHILRHIAPPHVGADRRQVSLTLCRRLLDSAGLDSFEHGDVWRRIAALRPIPGRRLDELAVAIRDRRSVPAHPGTSPPAAVHLAWVQAFGEAGRELGVLAADGHLGRGIRNILAHIVIFHWNRLGLDVTTQAVLARAAAEACLPTD